MKRSGAVAVVVGLLALSAACSSSQQSADDGRGLGSGTDPGAVPDPQAGGASITPWQANGTKDGTETGVDCGGAAAPPCAVGDGCSVGTDCTSSVCANAACQAPTSSDGVKNGDETDVDCGGKSTNAGACADGKACKAHADCTSDACSYAGKCLPPSEKSCTRHKGGDTCGPNGDQDCCTALPVATANNALVDKYEITAGRMRTFVERTNGEIRQWMSSNAPSWWNASWNQYLPTKLDAGTYPSYEGVYQQLGAVVYGTSGPTNEACSIGTGKDQIGARTYWLPSDVNAANGSVQNYDQDDLDERALNCVTAYMVAAFCAWDGGRLPTRAELDQAWGAKTYPWGDAPKPAGWYTVPETEPVLTDGTTLWLSGLSEFGAPKTCTYSSGPNTACDPFHANYVYNFWGGKKRLGNDYSSYIAPPGRFPLGSGPYGHADLAGLLFAVTTINDQGKTQWSKNGSFQGHDAPWTTYPSTSFLMAPATNKYWAAGGRCAR